MIGVVERLVRAELRMPAHARLFFAPMLPLILATRAKLARISYCAAVERAQTNSDLRTESDILLSVGHGMRNLLKDLNRNGG